ncbi:MAG: hypothetical protein C0596_08530 [Marinilabiliales bacterium]|nr:MAG: hypothetical protein C0596_08530 [Marinilabiliales bacterium]
MTNIKKDILVSLADDNFVDQVKQLFSSAYFNAGWHGDYMLLAHNITEEKLRWFRDKGILVRECEEIIDEKIGIGYSPVVLDKFCLFKTEFREWGNIIFLDADIIVRNSLERLSRVKAFTAARDSYFNKLKDQFYPNSLEKIKKDGYNLSKHSFNSGVMAFNSDIISDDTYDNLISLFAKYKDDGKFGEQPVLNLYFYKKFKKLPFIYNTFITHHNYKIPKRIKLINLHFFARENYPKLWEKENPYYAEWKNNLEKANTIVIKESLKKKALSQILIRWNSYRLWLHALICPYAYIWENIRYKMGHFFRFPGRLIGRIGSRIKMKNKKLYFCLKKLMFWRKSTI